VAWGFVDAVMYVMNQVLGRGRSVLLDRALREGGEPSELRAVLSEIVPGPLVEELTGERLDELRRRGIAHPDLHAAARVVGEDLVGALGVFVLVVATTFPVALPYLVVPDLGMAKAVSRGLALLLLFAAGYAVGRYSGVSPVRTGLVVLLIGAVLVGIVTAL